MKKLSTLFFMCFAFQFATAQIVTIPDPIFKDRLVNTNVADLNDDGVYSSPVDTNGDGEIQVSEAEAVIGLNVSAPYEGLASVVGIESFVNLKTLLLNNNDIESINVIPLSQLEVLNVERNELTILNVTQNLALKTVLAQRNDLQSLNVATLSQLETLDIRQNELIGLNVSQNPALKTLLIERNNITSIDVTQNPNLEYFGSVMNPIGNTDFTQNPNLKELTITHANMTALDVSQNVNLEVLDCSVNNLSSIDVSQNTLLKELDVLSNQLPSIDVSMLPDLERLDVSINLFATLDITQNSNLKELKASGVNNPSGGYTTIDLAQNPLLEILHLHYNSLTAIDLSQNALLKELDLGFNQLTALDISQNPLLDYMILRSNQLTTLDVSHQNSINFLLCSDNLLTSMDVSMHTELEYLNLNNNQLESLNIKNGASNIDTLVFGGNPNLAYVCADEEEIFFLQLFQIQPYGYTNCVVNSYCSFGQGGDTLTLTGTTRIDVDTDGCDVNDPPYQNLRVEIATAGDSGVFITNASGAYSIPALEAVTTITPQLENPSYFTVTPSSITVDLTAAADPYIQDFCVVPNGVHNDLLVVVTPREVARPGFDTDYRIIYKNNGNTVLSGSVDLVYDDDYMNFAVASPTQDTQSTGQLSWNFTNMAPQEVREIDFTMTLNTPTDANFPLNQDDVLSFTATVNPTTDDETPDNNVMTLNQTVVNSFDPNDKTCLEGDSIPEDKVGEYVHYMIRFENTGTASAINVIVTDDIDPAYYDINTLQTISSSHPFATRIQGQKVEFFFENINLPFDDANNDGYVLFKIKTINTLVANDTFSNKADIYFDFNAPIITELAETTVAAPLSVEGFTRDQSIIVYPVPVKDMLHIKGDHNLTNAALYDIKGTALIEVSAENNQRAISIPVHTIASGVYILKVESEKGNHISKIIK